MQQSQHRERLNPYALSAFAQLQYSYALAQNHKPTGLDASP